jgi:hypothetical protein
MRNKKFSVYTFLMAIIIFFAFMQAVSAYSIYDLVSYIQSLFSGNQRTAIGGIFQTANQCYGGDDPTCNPNDDNLKWNCHPYRCSLYEKQGDKDGCRFAGCTANEDTNPWTCAGNQNSCESYSSQENCQSAGCFWREGTSASSKDRACSSDVDCMSTSNDYPKCDLTADKNAPGFRNVCMACNGVKQTVGSGYNQGACEASCGADQECDGLDPSNDCASGKNCDSNCKCMQMTPAGAIQQIRVSWLDSNCQPKQIWGVYPEGDVPKIPAWKDEDCSAGNMRINMQYKNTGSSAAYFVFKTQMVGDAGNPGDVISTSRDRVEAGQESSHVHWVEMSGESITERNWLMSSPSDTGDLTEIERKDFRVNALATTSTSTTSSTTYTSTSSTTTESATATTTTTTAQIKGEIENIRASILNKDCSVKYTWNVYPEKQTTLFIPTFSKDEDCPDGNMRINMQYKNIGQSPAYFTFVAQTVGDKSGPGIEISTSETNLNPGEESSHAHWIKMWGEPVKQWNWLTASSRKGVNVSIPENTITFRVVNSASAIACKKVTDNSQRCRTFEREMKCEKIDANNWRCELSS